MKVSFKYRANVIEISSISCQYLNQSPKKSNIANIIPYASMYDPRTCLCQILPQFSCSLVCFEVVVRIVTKRFFFLQG